MIHLRWPHKQWNADFSFDDVMRFDRVSSTVTSLNDESVDNLVTKKGRSLSVKSRLVMMEAKASPDMQRHHQADIVRITSLKQVRDWTAACSEAFNYTIDVESIEQLLKDENAPIYGFLKQGNIAGTMVLYQTGRTLGVYQLGTTKQYRKMGIALGLMQHALAQANVLNCTLITLQASKAGLHLYQQLGFKPSAYLNSVITEQTS